MIKVGIVGGTGYTGVELLRLLAAHPAAELSVITSRAEAGTLVSDMFPNLRGRVSLRFSAPDVENLRRCDVVFFATPNGTAMSSVRELLDAGVRVIDLAADFRLAEPTLWQQLFGMPHACPELLGDAVYGLPEMNRVAVRGARLVANPGCYPTAVTQGLLPLVEAGVVDVHHLLPEIRQTLSRAAHGEGGLTFIPHLVPMTRGIHATLYARLTNATDVQALFEQRYANDPFVNVMPAGTHPAPPTVRGAN